MLITPYGTKSSTSLADATFLVKTLGSCIIVLIW